MVTAVTGHGTTGSQSTAQNYDDRSTFYKHSSPWQHGKWSNVSTGHRPTATT